MRQLESLQAEILECWTPIDHIQSVAQTEALKKAYQATLALITQWETELDQDKRFSQWIHRWAEHPDFTRLEEAQQKIIYNLLNHFHLAGVDLDAKKQKRYETLCLQLAKDSAQFESNIVDSSRESPILVEDKAQLKGLSERVITAAQTAAKQQGKLGWLFKLNGPTLQAIMTTAEDRTLRKTFYTTWITRASEKTHFDNSALMYQILAQRHELSQLTHFNNYAERSLADNKMAKTPQAVMDFLNQLLKAVRPHAEAELQALQAFAQQTGHVDTLYDWDLAYFSGKLSKAKFNLEEEKLRVYFPLPHVLKALYQLLHDQFQLHIEEISSLKAWDPEVKILEIRDNKETIRGYLYLDLYTRENKRSGAWVHEYTRRRLIDNQCLQLPIGFLTCNFSPPFKDEPALLIHDDVVTLFHEMGHALHHTLTQVNYAAVSGIEGVPWDAVEFPSQLLEQFPWEPLVLEKVSAHYQTGDSLPKETIQALNESRRFQSGLQLMRQLEFALFDFQLHLQFDPQKGPDQIQQCLDTIRKMTRVLPTPTFNRFQHSFAQIFSGGYGAGYYSYLWAEVLAADAFSRFTKEGLQEGRFNPKIGQDFIESVLELGGSVDILELFKKFQKREPDNQAFLNRWGLLPKAKKPYDIHTD